MRSRMKSALRAPVMSMKENVSLVVAMIMTFSCASGGIGERGEAVERLSEGCRTCCSRWAWRGETLALPCELANSRGAGTAKAGVAGGGVDSERELASDGGGCGGKSTAGTGLGLWPSPCSDERSDIGDERWRWGW